MGKRSPSLGFGGGHGRSPSLRIQLPRSDRGHHRMASEPQGLGAERMRRERSAGSTDSTSTISGRSGDSLDLGLGFRLGVESAGRANGDGECMDGWKGGCRKATPYPKKSTDDYFDDAEDDCDDE